MNAFIDADVKIFAGHGRLSATANADATVMLSLSAQRHIAATTVGTGSTSPMDCRVGSSS
ncbi:hypothetical protein JNUCC0626_48720 [Lentzea sp. JNUCC 0626]|uniref:hypothetical protein n=1 Tax=Lentzea sp. JNUCC 0626 TaxID=3367513 RepID=UPI00374975BB